MEPELPADEIALVTRAMAGGREAFDQLVRTHQDRIYGVIHRLVGDPEAAQDLTQDTFLKAWKGISQFAGKSGFFTWLYRIARNTVASHGRYVAARPRVRVSLDEPRREDGAVPDPEDPGDGPPERGLVRERRRLVLEAIRGLPPEFREIVVLRDMDDRSYEEIAELLELPLGTVRSRLHRARQELRERLQQVLGAGAREPR